ncbi:Uncharacterized protein SCF082_LOCUS24136 [Durusdinium trenchii]|uniref:Lipoprotein n=1 Tax=Durusdinium trenchii TaxID=1381693 RepID=A0ABP0LRU5_9DINO
MTGITVFPSFARRAALKRFFVIGATALIAGCTSITPYAPADRGGQGYFDQKLETGKYRVTFEGNSVTDRATIENYVLFRAAEITLRDGYDYFSILDQNTETVSTFRTTGTTFGGRGFGRRGFFYGGGFGGFGGFGANTSTTRERLSYVIGVIIQAEKGDKPAERPDAYDARQLIDNLGPTLTYPDPN